MPSGIEVLHNFWVLTFLGIAIGYAVVQLP